MALEKKILRKMYGLAYQNGQCRIKMNSESESRCKSQDIIFVIEVRTLE
jgi:hypothetical protein